jgi:hypothetical protein
MMQAVHAHREQLQAAAAAPMARRVQVAIMPDDEVKR